MNARQYRTEYDLSALDFPAITGLGTSTIDFKTETPIIVNNKVKLKITNKFILVDFYDKKEHEVLTAVAVYEIPVSNIKVGENIYECYKDAISGLNEAFAFAKKKLPLPDITFPAPPIETYQKEIERVFYLINTLN
jgi:hypothetical protein